MSWRGSTWVYRVSCRFGHRQGFSRLFAPLGTGEGFLILEPAECFLKFDIHGFSQLSDALGTAEIFLEFDIHGFSQFSDALGTAEVFLEFDIHGFPWLSASLGTDKGFLKIDVHD